LPKSSKKVDDSKGQQESKYYINKGLTATGVQADLSSDKPVQVPTDDCTNTANVPDSNKLNNKPDNKPGGLDTEIVKIVQTWPSLPDVIRSVILTLIRTTSWTT
jgi:hypothetical protein